MQHPVTVLGPGRRAGIWFQGCTIRCPGCAATDTWRADPATAVPLEELMTWLTAIPPEQLDGVTISGGEPTEQPEALRALLARIRGLARSRARAGLAPAELDVLVFTGREPGWVETTGRGLFAGADAVMAGPYRADLPGSSPLRGSENQRLVVLTARGRRRFTPEHLGGRARLQLEQVDGGVWMIGIPPPGVLAQLRARAEQGGVQLRGPSWGT